ncbi:DUF4158 domain-containing protein [Streptomyces sp. NPDC001276]|uniref:DUF4158 domain-containing protein n=1 Tax=Streptomyces sp. NPDC001276 TaxID=3364555 RepID=UPI00368C3AB8
MSRPRHTGAFTEEPTRPELERFFFLDDDDRDLIALRRTDAHRRGMALQTLHGPLYQPVPGRGPARGAWEAVEYLAGQLGIADPGRSITSIAKLLGVSPGTLYNHIPDLAELRASAARRAQRGQQCGPYVLARVPEIRGVHLDRPCSPGGHQFLRAVREQSLRQAELAYGGQLGDLRQERVQAHRARFPLQRSQKRGAVLVALRHQVPVTAHRRPARHHVLWRPLPAHERSPLHRLFVRPNEPAGHEATGGQKGAAATLHRGSEIGHRGHEARGFRGTEGFSAGTRGSGVLIPGCRPLGLL